MTHVRETITVTHDSAGADAVHLLLTEGDVKRIAEDPERVMEDIETRATLVSSVLKGILLEPHGRVDWGIND
jgi:hypothetical protein